MHLLLDLLVWTTGTAMILVVLIGLLFIAVMTAAIFNEPTHTHNTEPLRNQYAHNH